MKQTQMQLYFEGAAGNVTGSCSRLSYTCGDEKYQILVDNDDVFVVDVQNEECESLYTFSAFGYDMLFHVLKFLKCNVEYV